jgi:UDP-N-acetylmuramate--alanine ligase
MMVKRVYFIGIGGIGMSAIARYYNHSGISVAGYDRTRSKLTEELEGEGISIHYEDNCSLIPEEFIGAREKTLVIYTPAVPGDMTELQYFIQNGYNIVKRSKALGVIAAQKKCLAVAGTHGKTTTSTLLAHIMTHSGRGCTAFLGGISKNYHSNLLLSKSEYLVAEADEFDRSFLQLYPDTAIITAADADHLDIYGNTGKFKEAFAEFASQIKEGGNLILKKGVEIDQSRIKAKIYSYSYDKEADFYASEINQVEGGFFRFNLNHPGGVIKECRLGIPGWVNTENAIAASAAAILNGINEEELRGALADFKGVERRFDIKLNTPECAYIDDYAHHPQEIRAAISSMRNIFAGRRLTGIFQPHLYTRTRDFASEFAESLSALDSLILLDIYPARELPIEGVTSKIIFDKVTIQDKVLITKEELLPLIEQRDTDALISFGAGDIDRFTGPLTNLLKKKYNV